MIHKLIYGIDQLSKMVGHAFAWCILILTFGTCYEVFVRYVLDNPTSWAFDMSYLMYGGLFFMGGAYTLSRNGHVRGDFISLAFEAVSALGTVGLSLGATPALTPAGKVIIIALMFLGRLGPLAFVYSVAQSLRDRGYRLAEERVIMG